MERQYSLTHRRWGIAAAVAVISGGGYLASARLAAPAAAQQPSPRFPFALPWDDASESITSAASLNPAPLTSAEKLTARDGHFYAQSGKRVKFIGVSIGAASAFPDRETAEKVAAHLHKLGVNLVRLHHMDARWSTPNLFNFAGSYTRTTGADGKTKLDPKSLERFDYFVAQLKKQGIYLDLNLHVSREWLPADGFPNGPLPELGKVVAYFDPRAIRLQKEFAALLLTHTNPYTKTPLATDPVLALVEINNEDSLLGSAGQVASLPMAKTLVTGWNGYLKSRYATTTALKKAWSGGGGALGPEQLKPESAWTAETHDATTMRLAVESAAGQTNAPRGPVLHATDLKPDATNWHLQIHQTGLTLKAGQTYTLSFVARASKPRSIGVNARLDQAPWSMVGLDQTVALTTNWKRYTYTFIANGSGVPGHCRISLMVGDSDGDLFLGEASLRTGSGGVSLPTGESLEAGNVALPTIGASPSGRDYVRYLMTVEEHFAVGMRSYVRSLGCTAPVTCSQASYGGIGGVYRESKLDWVDMHAYWQHPSFPGNPFDPENYRIENTAMVRDKGAGTLDGLAMHRVAGKPFTVSEYDHPAPSEWAAEMIPTIFSYAAWQDWDGVFVFAYETNHADNIRGFFEQNAHTGKLASLPFAASIFLRGDLAPNPNTISLAVPNSAVASLKAAGTDYAFWSLPQTRLVAGEQKDAPEKADALAFLTHRASVSFESAPGPIAFVVAQPSAPSDGFVWDHGKSVITVNSAASKGIIGQLAGSEVGGLSAQLITSNFGVLTLSARDGLPTERSHALLLTALEKAENPGLEWNTERTFAKNAWRSGPVEAQPLQGTVRVTTTASKARVWALDPTGKRLREVPSKLDRGALSLTLSPEHRTVWYEIVAGN